MSLDDFYINSIATKKKDNMEIYKKVLIKLFGKELSWSEVKELPRDDQMKLILRLRDQISIDNSPYDIRKLARAIQDSRSGIGGSAITLSSYQKYSLLRLILHILLKNRYLFEHDILSFLSPPNKKQIS